MRIMDADAVQSIRDSIRARLMIDEHQLIDECKNQAAFYEEVSSNFAQIKSDAKKAKSILEFVKSELERSIRSEPARFGVEKTTDSVVSSAVVVQPGYQVCVTNLREAERLADSVQAMVFAVEQRKSMIRDLVSLYQCDYRNMETSIKGSDKLSGDTRADEITNSRRKAKENLDNG